MTNRYHFFETDTDIFKKIFMDWPIATLQLATDTNIEKFTYRYICR